MVSNFFIFMMHSKFKFTNLYKKLFVKYLKTTQKQNEMTANGYFIDTMVATCWLTFVD